MQQKNSEKQNFTRQLSLTSLKPPFGGDYHRFDAGSGRGQPNQEADQVVVIKTPPVSFSFLNPCYTDFIFVLIFIFSV